MDMKADVTYVFGVVKHLLVVLLQCVEKPMGMVDNLGLANSRSNPSILNRQE
jgi:hypothetical protein